MVCSREYSWFFCNAPVIIFGTFFILVYVIAYFTHKAKLEKFKTLSLVLNAKSGGFFLAPYCKGDIYGFPFVISTMPESKNTPAYLRIVLKKNNHFNLKIYRENYLSELGKKLKLVHEVKIQDPGFDLDFQIYSNKGDEAGKFLNNSHVKDKIREIFNDGFDSFVMDSKNMIIQKPNYTEGDLDPVRVTEWLKKLVSLSQTN